jgi:HK97 family phage prohead protease
MSALNHAPQALRGNHAPGMFKRSARMDQMPADGKLPMVASTDAPMDMGGWREVLSHADGAVDYGAATALLLNHDPNRLVGPLRDCGTDAKSFRCAAELLPNAKMESGVLVEDAIKSGALRGISVGYTYTQDNTSWDEKSRTLTVNKWRLLECSLTPIPMDSDSGLRCARAVPFDLDKQPPAPVADNSKERHMAEPVNPPAADAGAIRAEAQEVATLARSLNLDAAEYVTLSKVDAQAKMLEAVAKRSADAHKEPVAKVQMLSEECDKHAAGIADAYQARCLGGKAKDGNPYAGRSLLEMAQRFARSQGFKTEDWTRKDAAHFVLGEMSQVRGARDANIIVASFPNFVMADVITKIVARGFEAAADSGLSRVYETQIVPDFKQFTIGGLGTGNLQETAENVAFPELAKSEGYFNAQVKMWGGTLSLSLQALINDDTASFDRSLRQAGAIAQKTIEKRVIQKFLRGTASTDASTWTNNTTSGCTPVFTTADTLAAARANIGKAKAALMQKIGLDGNPTGAMGRFILAPPTAGIYLGSLLGQAPGQTVANASGQMELIVSPWLEASTVTGYSTTSYYVVADPMLVTGLVLSKISGYESIQVQEYDAGAVGARKWKMWLPFEADLVSMANSAGTTIIAAAQQATT